MADVDDRWYRREPTHEAGGSRRVPSRRHGSGKRYAARWRDEAGRQRTKSFDRKRDAELFLASVRTDMNRGSYVDPSAGKVRLRTYAERWLSAQTFDESTREAVAIRLRLHVLPVLGGYELRSLKPSVVQAWTRGLQSSLAASYVRVIFANLSAIMRAAVDDGLLATNPCRTSSVRPPTVDRRRVVPWQASQVDGVQQALPERYAALITVGVGLGLRQGEVFGLAADDVDWLRGVVHVRRQIKIVGARQVFAPPKRGKERDVPLAEGVALALSAHLQTWPAVEVVLPWQQGGGRSVAVPLIFTTRESTAINRNYFNSFVWKPALRKAGVPATRENGMHALRHRFASVLLDGGASVKELAEWLGHADPGFTLRVYTHLLPSGADRMRRAVDLALRGEQDDGPSPECAPDVRPAKG